MNYYIQNDKFKVELESTGKIISGPFIYGPIITKQEELTKFIADYSEAVGVSSVALLSETEKAMRRNAFDFARIYR